MADFIRSDSDLRIYSRSNSRPKGQGNEPIYPTLAMTPIKTPVIRIVYIITITPKYPDYYI